MVKDGAGGSAVLAKIREWGLIAVVRGASCEAAVEVASALIEGDVLGIEIAFTTPEAHAAIRDLDEEYGDRILLGAGTVTNSGQVEKSVRAGANFLVSPGCDPDLVPIMRQTGLAILPGVLTPSEVVLAMGLGVEAVKLFPGSLGGPSYLKALLGPFPGMAFLPTGGVSAGNVRDWFSAGAFAVGVGGAIAPPNLDGEADRRRLIAQAKQIAEAVRSAKAGLSDPTAEQTK